jgi:hypothetical protein
MTRKNPQSETAIPHGLNDQILHENYFFYISIVYYEDNFDFLKFLPFLN